ncbi:response regulator [Oceanobacter mangrovi]|uniref:response regulator n=1 Tax=Oceanobacter mangrovi TaxID=2862510 RepID=UPI001C8F0763|nr:response regulator [Oceanobacter mangrovi]
MRILLAEDDHLIGSSVQQRLRDEACAVDWVQDGNSAATAIATHPYDLLLLDLGLPGQDGMKVLQQLRANRNPLPVIVITARDSLDERIRGLDLGADDFLVKPFAMTELLARMRAVHRRHQGNTTPLLGNGVLELNLLTHSARRDDREISLTGREFALLQALLHRPGAILSRSDLEDRIYGWNEEVESNAIEFIIHSLRKKLGADAIKNVRGVGWLVDRES